MQTSRFLIDFWGADNHHTRAMRIANLDCLNRFQLAPMCDVTDWTYRKLCRDQGAGLLMTEMISSVHLAQSSKKVRRMVMTETDEAPVGVQISGHSTETMVKAARIVEDSGASMLNVNCGCPVKKIIKGGSGSALLRDLDRLQDICRALRKAISIPLTIKVRAGWDERNVNALDVGKLAESEGVDAIMIHPRTREQKYEGNANWDLIRQLVDAVSIPVIGNGDIFHPADGIRMMEETGCAAIMVGRGAMGNPWIFRGLHAHAQGDTSEDWRPTPDELDAVLREHMARMMEYAGELHGCHKMRKQLVWYTAKLPGARAFKSRFQLVESKAQFDELLSEFIEQWRHSPARDTESLDAAGPDTNQACAV
jgi:tRNA-dihydrouridine synthase B